MARFRNPNPSRIGTIQPCRVCGTAFIKDHGRRVTCSPECQDLARHPVINTRCTWCDQPMTQSGRDAERGHRAACSAICRAALKMLTSGATSRPWSPPKSSVPPAQPKPPWREERDCAWCEARFTAKNPVTIYCSPQHRRKAGKVRRRGRQQGWDSHFALAELMRVFITFDRRCAYCEQPIEGALPEPDHVVPLSRGGPDGITNILPACHLCNSDKRDHLLHEWASDRARLGKPPVVTSWEWEDQRFRHLTFIRRDLAS